ncbi:putative cytochrome b5 [Whalleya microplaca]|nr:putative cytochrome b5 [Whalleya microplaca]
MAEKEFTFQDVAEHNTKKDLFLVIHDKVYDSTKFVDEHPGGEEVMLDVGGQDATEAFEDVGHSDEARETLEHMLVGSLKRQPGDPEPKATGPSLAPPANTSSAGFGTILYAVIFVGGLVAFGAYQYLQAQEAQQAQHSQEASA